MPTFDANVAVEGARSAESCRSPHLVETCNELRTVIETVRSKLSLSGIAAIVKQRERQITASVGDLECAHLEASGNHMRFHVGCLALLLGAIVCTSLSKRGNLNMENSLGEYLPELRDAPVGSAKVWHLLCHTAGYQAPSWDDFRKTCRKWTHIADVLEHARQLFVPGTVFDFQYSNGAILGEIVQRVTGQSFTSVARETLQQVVGMDLVGSETNWPKFGRFPEAWRAAISDSTISLPELVTLVTHCSTVNGNGSLTAPYWQPRIHMPPPIDEHPMEVGPAAFGLGAAIYPRGFVGANGSGPNDCICVRIHGELGIVVAVGLSSVNFMARARILAAIYDFLSIPNGSYAGRQYYQRLSLSDFGGAYVGPGRSTITAVSNSRDDLLLMHSNGTVGSARTMRVARDRDQNLVTQPHPLWFLGLLKESENHSPVVMLGLNAYKHVSLCR